MVNPKHTLRMSDALFQPFPMLSGRRAQVWRHEPAYRRPRHFHAEPELNVVFRGWALMGVGTHEVLMQPGDVLFLKPTQDHVMLDCSDDLDLFVIAATPELATRFHTGVLPTTTTVLRLSESKADETLQTLCELGDVVSSAPHEAAVGGLFEWALPLAPGGRATSRKLLSSIYDDAHQGAGELARVWGIDAAELSRSFASDLGVKFVEARARMRLIRFIQSVDQGHSLTRAAAEHFGSYAQCHRVFRRYLGCAPREFFAGRRNSLAEATFDRRSEWQPPGVALS